MNNLEKEPKKWFTVFVKTKDGKLITVQKMAVSTWHAIDKVYFEHCDDQPDRQRYWAGATMN